MPKNYRQLLFDLMAEVAKEKASDLHISAGQPPVLRVDGHLVPLKRYSVLGPEDSKELTYVMLDDSRREALEKERGIDFSYTHRGKMRFRVNSYYQSGYISSALRFIPAKIRTIEELNLPAILHRFSKLMQGFVLVVGPAGHGKSTTLAALIDEINHSRADHVITIEDPIEYIFSPDRCIVDQREVGRDTQSFARALRASFRQDPDVIMVGEMRDRVTMATAISAAETGHLVFATLHTNNASQTINRIIDSFPPDQQGQIRSQLALSLAGIISERLVPRLEGGRIPAVEVLIANSAVRNLIREKKIYEINLVIETSAQEGMISLNRSLADLVRRGEISMEQADLYSLNPQELQALIRG